MTSRASTIFALSSGQLPSGIAIVRTSGPGSGPALSRIAGFVPVPRKATRAALRRADGDTIDDALVLWFPAPRSATGEDVAEFHVHGGRAVVAALLAALALIDDMRPAEPGEFSRRAFENGKLDLVAAEALDDLIHADTDQQRRQALRQLGGLLGNRARDWRQRIIDISALVEASIDFSDEGDVGPDHLGAAIEAMTVLRSEIDDVLVSSQNSERLRDGLVVVIAGRPNVGKSTLLNALARRDVAIVTPHAGTTRDSLEVHLDLGGYPVTLIDTAGLRAATDPVEQEGIRRAKDRAATADLVLLLKDTGEDCGQRFDGTAVWTVETKADLVTGDNGGRGEPARCDYQISARSGQGIESLTRAISAFAAHQFPTEAEAGMVTRIRHRELLNAASAGLHDALRESEPELIAEGLRNATHALGRLLGRIDVENVLGSIFSKFCIGK